jgi:gamma-glutamylaminecyclotransferase
MNPPRLLFVYGTLKRGLCRHHALAGARFIGEARTPPDFRLIHLGTYPGLVRDTPGVSIRGELWEVDADCLARLDEVEGVDEGLYRREAISLLDPFADQSVQTYIYARGIAGLPDCGNCWV